MKSVSVKGSSRKIFVCLTQKCVRCDVDTVTPPGDCPWRILHLLETKPGGYQAMPRQSGKTTQIVSMANLLVTGTMPVWIVTMTRDMVNHMKHNHAIHPDVQLFSERQGPTVFRGRQPGYVLFDEVLPRQVEELLRIMPSCHFVAAYYTPR
jgi:hypothetical protein